MSQPSSSRQRRGKKECERGKNCPYKHEYQHELEFYHTEEENDQKNGVGKFIPFQSKGNAIFKQKNNTIGRYCTKISESCIENKNNNKHKISLRNQRMKIFESKNSLIKQINNSSIQNMSNDPIRFKKVNSRKKVLQSSMRNRIKKVENAIIDLIDDEHEFSVKETAFSQTINSNKKGSFLLPSSRCGLRLATA